MKLTRLYVVDGDGNKQVGVPVAVRQPGDVALVSLWATNNNTLPTIPNPMTTDADGKIEFYAANQLVDYVVKPGELTERKIGTEEIFDGVGSTAEINTILGAAAATGHFGTFTGVTIPDNVAAKPALQALETATELRATSSALAAAGGAALIGLTRSETGSILQTLDAQANLLPVTLEQFGGVGVTGATAPVDNVAAFNAFRTWRAAVKAANPETWVVLQLAPGKLYGTTDCTWSMGLDRLYVLARGARFKNILADAASPWDQDKFGIYAGGIGYVEFVAGTKLEDKNITPNSTLSKAINSSVIGANTVTCTTAADALTFAAGEWVCIRDGVAFIGGSPPSPQKFEFMQVSAVDAGTGVVTLTGELSNSYSSELPPYDDTYRSGAWGAQAAIFKMEPNWNVQQVWDGLEVLPSTAKPNYGGYFTGRDIKLLNCNLPGHTSTQCAKFEFIGGSSKNNSVFEPVDKLVKLSRHVGVEMFCAGTIGGDGNDGQHIYESCIIRADFRVHRNTQVSSCNFNGDISAGYGTNLHFTGNSPCKTFSTIEARALTIDGTSVTVAGSVITIPISTLSGGNGQFIERVQVGAELWGVDGTSGGATYTDHVAIVTGLTLSGTNLLLTLNSSIALANGQILRPAMIQSYHGSGNMSHTGNADLKTGVSTGAIPNGDLDAFLANNIRVRFAGASGTQLNREDFLCRGKIKRVVIDVQRAYTGVTYATLFAVIYTVKPAFAEHVGVDLKTVGRREITPLGNSGVLGVDVFTNLKTFVSKWFMFISSARNGAPVTMSEAANLLPIVDILLEVDGGSINSPRVTN